MNVIASQRALGYANHLKKCGLEPTILTFDWSKSFHDRQCSKKEFGAKITNEKYENYNVISIPVLKNRVSSFFLKKEGTVIYFFWILYCWLKGELDVRPDKVMHGKSEAYFLKVFPDLRKYDVVMGIYSPHFHLRNCSKFCVQKGIPYVLDFRDLWNNHELEENYRPSLSKRIYNMSSRIYWKKWCKNAVLLSITSKPWLEKLSQVVKKDGVVIHNGFEPSDLNYIESDLLNIKEFNVLYTGTLYPDQSLEFMIKGIKTFISELEDRNVKVVFIGLEQTQHNEFSLKIIKENLNPENYLLTGKIERGKVLYLQNRANLLFFPTTLKIPGTFSGKIFEYINSETDTLAGPRDLSAVCELIESTNSGNICEDEESLVRTLHDYYQKWKLGQSILKEKKIDVINKYTRASQAKIMANEILKRLN